MMLGFLLARAGVDVLVLEKHSDFLRDFRGDTIHPSTLEVMHELGLLDAFLALPHQEVLQLSGQIYGETITIADFTHLPGHCKFLAIMPQWDFLTFLAIQGSRYPGFGLRMQAEVTGVLERDGVIAGVTANTSEGELEVHADLVIGADGRHSKVRELAGLRTEELGVPIDVLWFRLPRGASDNMAATGGYLMPGRLLVMINRDSYWQCGYVIPKGGFDNIRSAGLAAFRTRVAELVPFLGAAVQALESWDAVSLLTVQVNRMPMWFRTGLLCIGDAAHAMSPVGGVGINLAIQDAVAAANILAAPLREGRLKDSDLVAVQRRRTLPTWLTQRAQLAIQNRIIMRVLASNTALPPKLPFALRLFQRFPFLRRIPARLVGIGVRPEHVALP